MCHVPSETFHPCLVSVYRYHVLDFILWSDFRTVQGKVSSRLFRLKSISSMGKDLHIIRIILHSTFRTMGVPHTASCISLFYRILLENRELLF